MAEVRVFTRKDVDPGGENWRGKIIEHAREVAAYDEQGSEIVGYIVLGLFSDGAHAMTWRYDPSRCPIPRRLLPAYVEELVRENVIVRTEIEAAAEENEEE